MEAPLDQLPPPPGPSGSRLRLALKFRKDPFSLLSEYRQRYGDLFLLPLLGIGNWVCVCSPDLSDDLYSIKGDVASAADFNAAFLTRVMGPSSFVGKEDDEHRERRGALTKYLNGRLALEQVPVIQQEVLRQLASWPRDEVFPLLPHAMRLSLGTNYRIILGLHDPEPLDELVDLTLHFFDLAMKSPLVTMPALQWDLGKWSPWGRIVHLRNKVRSLLRKHVEDLSAKPSAKDSKGPTNVLEALAACRYAGGRSLTVEEIVDDLLIILNAGQETSSRILTWTIAGIMTHPAVRETFEEELANELGGQPIDSDGVERLQYLDAVVQEGIRYRPFSPFIGGRVVRQPFDLGGYEMPVGATIIHAHAEVCMRDDLFPEPRSFDPDANFSDRKFTRGQWAPFGGGAHLCLGRGLALVQLRTLLATIFQQLDLELCQDEVRPIPAGFLYVPEHGLKIRVRSRSA